MQSDLRVGGATPAPGLVLPLGVGAAQGIAFWALSECGKRGVWPATSPEVFGALIAFALAAPLAWYLGHGAFGGEVRRAGIACTLGLLFAALGAHVGAIAQVGEWPPSLNAYLLAGGVLGFVTVALVCGWNARTRRFDYPRLFELAWRNENLIVLAAMLTGVLWVLLWAGALLMQSIGLTGLSELYRKRGFFMPVTGAAFGLSVALVLGRAEMLVTVRRLTLSLLVWFLPLALAFAVAWTIALPLTGVEVLFGTGNAAFYLLWFATLGIVFVNAAFQDGRGAPPYPRRVALAMHWAWLTMTIVVALAGWALWQRVAQHGWTPDRIWAAVVWMLVTIHSFGYAASIAQRRSWMRTIAMTNIAAAIVEVLAIVALTSPIADMHRLSVASQVARLRSGAVGPGEFDWALLSHGTARYGRDALAVLAADRGTDERSRAIAQRAAEVVREPPGRYGAMKQDPEKARAILRERVAVRPAGVTPDPALIAWIAREQTGADERNCVMRPDKCLLWVVDLDGDGNVEAILVSERGKTVSSALYVRDADSWRREGYLSGRLPPMAQWLDAIDAGHTALVPPRWKDLTINGERLKPRP